MPSVGVGKKDCRKMFAILENKDGAYKTVLVRCKQWDCQCCHAQLLDEWRGCIEYAISKYNLRMFFTLTADPNSPDKIFNDWKNIAVAHNKLRYNLYYNHMRHRHKAKKTLKAYRDYFVRAGLSQSGIVNYDDFLTLVLSFGASDLFVLPRDTTDTAYNAYILRVLYYDIMCHFRRIYQNAINSNYRWWIDNKSLDLYDCFYARIQYELSSNKHYIVNMIKESINNIRNAQKIDDGFQFVKVLEVQKNGNPHFHTLCNYVVSGIVDMVCGTERIKDIQDLMLDNETPQKVCRYITKYLTKTASRDVSAYRKLHKTTVSFCETSMVRFKGKLRSIHSLYCDLSGYKADDGWHMVPYFESMYYAADPFKLPLKLGKVYQDSRELYDDYKNEFTKYEEIKSQNNVYDAFDNLWKVKEEIIYRYFEEHKNDDNISSKRVDCKKWENNVRDRIDMYALQCVISEVKRRNKIAMPFLSRQNNNIALDAEQKSALEQIEHNAITCLVGPAGTGKSYTISQLRNYYYLNNKKIAGVALSSHAAKILHDAGVESCNIHRFCHASYAENGFVGRLPFIDADFLIIDEASMLQPHEVLYILSRTKNDSRIIFVGDLWQLPPVNCCVSVFNEISKIVPTTILCTNYRAQSDIYPVCASMRENDFAMLLSKIKPYEESEQLDDYVYIAPTHRVRKLINNKISGKNDGFISHFEKFSDGDNIVFTKNNINFGYYNGDTGKIICHDDYYIYVELDFANEKGKFVKSAIHSCHFMLSNVLTAHKAQGSQFKKVCVVVDVNDNSTAVVNANWIYTACTRAQDSLEIRIIGPGTFNENMSKLKEMLRWYNYNNVDCDVVDDSLLLFPDLPIGYVVDESSSCLAANFLPPF